MNKRTLHRLISLLAALVMAVFLLTGCGTKTAEQVQQQEDAQTIQVYRHPADPRTGRPCTGKDPDPCHDRQRIRRRPPQCLGKRHERIFVQAHRDRRPCAGAAQNFVTSRLSGIKNKAPAAICSPEVKTSVTLAVGAFAFGRCLFQYMPQSSFLYSLLFTSSISCLFYSAPCGICPADGGVSSFFAVSVLPPPQAVSAAVAAVMPQTRKNERREIFFIIRIFSSHFRRQYHASAVAQCCFSDSYTSHRNSDACEQTALSFASITP